MYNLDLKLNVVVYFNGCRYLGISEVLPKQVLFINRLKTVYN